MLSLQHCEMKLGKLLTYVIGAAVGLAASLCLYGQSTLKKILNNYCAASAARRKSLVSSLSV